MTSSAAALGVLPQLITSFDFSCLSFKRSESCEGWAASVIDVKYNDRMSLRCKQVAARKKPEVDLPFGMSVDPDLLKKPKASKGDPAGEAGGDDESDEEAAELEGKEGDIPSEGESSEEQSASSGILTPPNDRGYNIGDVRG